MQPLLPALQYGRQLVPITKENELAMQYRPPTGMQLIGTVAHDQVPRHCFMHVSRCFCCLLCLLNLR